MEIDEEDYLDTDFEDLNDQYQSYNKHSVLLPFADEIPAEADRWWNWIKINLPRCLEAMEIRPGLLVIDRYLRVYLSLHRIELNHNLSYWQ